MRDAPVLVDNRESLIYLLSEAAEIEHGLMCSYLYAAFSLRRSNESWSARQAEAVARWRAELLAVAREEMLHLASVSNLLNAIGGAPHLTRPNFPVWEGYHPSGVTLLLAPFSAAAVDHFVYMERPEGSTVVDGEGFATTMNLERKVITGRLVPTAQDFDTVGHLYRGIADGFATLAGRLGPRNLFVGDPALQLDSSAMPLPGLHAVTDLASAEHALETIVAQGEGVVTCDGRSHYRRFVEVRRQLQDELDADPRFVPAWPAARHPVMRVPANPKERVHVILEPAASLLDLANACYVLTLRALEALMSPSATSTSARGVIAELTIESMRWMAPVAERLASLPANPAYPGVNAGMTFTMSRSLRTVADREAAFRGLSEACLGIAQRAHELEPHAPDVLPRMAQALTRLSSAVLTLCSDRAAARKSAPAPAQKPASVAGGKAAATEGFCGGARASSKLNVAAPAIEIAEGEAIEIRFESARCIHARHCVLGAPNVFLANTPGQWLVPDAAHVEDLITIAKMCPSGAITYARKDGGPEELPPPVNTIRVRENGPLAVHAELRIPNAKPGFRATLCRCGLSANKPYCDGSHVAAGFAATGEPATGSVDPLPTRDGVLALEPLQNGPLRLTGNVEICAGTGRSILRTTSVRLCRCGHSGNKPFCDGSHTNAGFIADGA